MLRSRPARLMATAAILGACLAPLTARAWWRGGVFIGVPPVVVGPPAYYYPPAYYPPAAYYPPVPGYYAQPPAYTPAPQAQGQASRANVPNGTTCYAGFYVCAAPASTPVGSGCSCAGLGAPSYGVVN